MKRKIIGALTVLLAAGTMASGALQADAMSIPTPPRPYTPIPLVAKTPAYQLLTDGSIYQAQFNQNVWKQLLGVPNGSVYNSSLNNGIVSENKLAPAVVAKLNKTTPAEVFGKLGGELKINPTDIDTIGGKWIDGKTTLGSLTLPAGTYLVNSEVTIDRLDKTETGYLVPTTDTMPQFALRFDINVNNTFGTSAGTVMGNPISKAGYTELTGSSTKLVFLDAETTITAYGFGYNEDRSGFGSKTATDAAQFKVSGTVAAVRVK